MTMIFRSSSRTLPLAARLNVALKGIVFEGVVNASHFSHADFPSGYTDWPACVATFRLQWSFIRIQRPTEEIVTSEPLLHPIRKAGV